jgi:hypothetical protein
VVTDEEIALTSPEERRNLIRRLSLASWNVTTCHDSRRHHRHPGDYGAAL